MVTANKTQELVSSEPIAFQSMTASIVDPAPSLANEIVLDLSRLLSRVLHATPTGVDRVEMAYARGLLASDHTKVSFAAVHPTGLYGRIDRSAAIAFLDRTEQHWEAGTIGDAAQSVTRLARAMIELRPRRIPKTGAASRLYVQASPHHLTRPQLVKSILRREQARMVCLVHDLIPLQYPEYARTGGAAEHRVRVETIVDHCDGIVVNSHATLAALQPWIDASGRRPATAVAYLGTDVSRSSAEPVTRLRPYFVVLGTIEARKNHLLLLNIWRRLSELRGPGAVPSLVLIGRRGWENEQVLDMLDRCPALVGCVEEHADLPDARVRSVLAGARALLMPSFAEGYGMPVVEALAAGVPVLCSDLPAHREAGANAPDFLDPLDALGWIRAIEAYTPAASPLRAAQLERIRSWTHPTWTAHIAILLDLSRRVMA